MKVIKIVGIAAGVLLGVIILAVVGLHFYLASGYFDGYDPSAPLDAVVSDVQERDDYIRQHIYFKGFDGDSVPLLVARPKEGDGPWPCVMFLHGIGQNKGFLDEIAGPFVKAGFLFCSFDQLMQGERDLKEASIFEQAGAFLRRPCHTVNDTRRLIDYLETRPDVISDRIYLAGASYGAITGTTATALDKRIRAAALCYGGGNIPKMLEARMVKAEIGPWMPLAKVVAWTLLSGADPLRYAGQIAPRPAFLQNGTDDCLIATPCAKALQDAVQEPKKITWYEGDHIGMDKPTVLRVLKDIVEWLQEQDARVVSEGGTAGQAVQDAA